MKGLRSIARSGGQIVDALIWRWRWRGQGELLDVAATFGYYPGSGESPAEFKRRALSGAKASR